MDPPFEMSLPHAKRVKQLDSTGVEDQPVDSDLWELHALVQKAIQVRGLPCFREAVLCRAAL